MNILRMFWLFLVSSGIMITIIYWLFALLAAVYSPDTSAETYIIRYWTPQTGRNTVHIQVPSPRVPLRTTGTMKEKWDQAYRACLGYQSKAGCDEMYDGGGYYDPQKQEYFLNDWEEAQAGMTGDVQ